MENHPIPQDVTGFKFKLIGSVTVKQFLYIMAGGIMCAVFFMIPISIFIKIPLCIIFGGGGAALAFIPIEGRPMDVMIKNFLKALPAENQYIYKKRGAEVLIAELFTPKPIASQKAIVQKTTDQESREAKRAMLFKTLRQSYRPDDKESAVLSNINTYLDESAQPVNHPVQRVDAPPSPLTQVVAPPPAPVELPKEPTPPAQPQMTSTQDIKVVMPTPAREIPIAKPAPPIQQVEKIEQPTPPPAPVAQPVQQPKPVSEPEPQSPHVTVEPAAPIPTQSAPLTTVTPTAPTAPQALTPDQSQNVSSVAPEASLKAGFPSLPDTPNIVMGIIKDPRGKVLPNILVEFMDEQGIPVRAFKSNALGQFTAATPLPNGEYNILLEDPRKQNEFEQIHIELTGEIFEPLEIISTDQREKLRRELFGGSAAQVAA